MIDYKAPAEVLSEVLHALEPQTRREVELTCKAFNLGVEFTLGEKIYKQIPALFKPTN